MKSRLIHGDEEKLLTFSECLKETGIYKTKNDSYVDGENLVVVYAIPNAEYFGMYDNGDVFPCVDHSENDEKEYIRIGDIELTVKVIK